MIPRVRPSYNWVDLKAALRPDPYSVESFEHELAAYFGIKYAITFPYGRSAIYACLQALSLDGNEVVQPAYNCVVVAHATMLAGYRPVFVDAQSCSPNQNPDDMIEQVNQNTAAVIPTSIFGVTFDAATLCEAIRRRNHKALILMDCCQCFDARWQDQLLAAQGDAAVLAFGIGKPMTALYGGALLTNKLELAEAVLAYRAAQFRAPPRGLLWRRWFYFLASWLALSGSFVRLTDWLEFADTPLRRYLMTLRTRETIKLPQDNQMLMPAMQAAIGQTQLSRASNLMNRRRKIAAIYTDALQNLPGLELLDWGEGASYAIYAARLAQPEERQRVLACLRRYGVQGDTVLSYVVPELECYQVEGYRGHAFPNALGWSNSVINLPNHPTMTDGQVQHVAQTVQRIFTRESVKT